MTNESTKRAILHDGTVLNFPAGTSDEVIGNTVQSYLQRKGAQSSAGPGFNAGAFVDTVADLPRYTRNALSSFATGAMDLPVGAGQLVSEAAGLAGATGFRDRYRDYMRSREQQYQAGRESDALDIGRITGNVVAGGLTAAGGAVAPTLAGRMATGAKIGAVMGTTGPVDPERDFWSPKAVQTVVGAAFGGAAPAIVEPVVRAVGSAVNAIGNMALGFKNAVSIMTPGKIESTLKLEFERGGLDWSKIPEQVREQLVGQTREALRSGGNLDADAVRRLVAFERAGVEPTRAQLNRDPSEFAREQNLARTEIGQPLAERFGQQNRQLVDRLDETRAATGAQGTDPYSSGQRAIESLTTRDAGRKREVDQAYKRFRETAGMDADVPMQRVAQGYGQIVEDFGANNVPTAVASRLSEFGLNGGTQTRVFNLREAEKLKTLIDNNTERGTPSGVAMARLKRMVDESVLEAAQGSGGAAETATAAQEARRLASQRFAINERTPAMEAALSRDAAPERFVEQQFIRGSVQDVANGMRQLDLQGRREVRAAVIDWIKRNSVPAAAEDAQTLNQGGINRALATLGPRKLGLIFAGDREGATMLKALGDVATYTQKPPVASGVNTSNSFNAALDFMDQASRMPGIGWLMGRPSDVIRAHQVSSAMVPGAPVMPAGPLLSPEMINRVGSGIGLLTAPGFGVLPNLLGNPNRPVNP